MFTLYIVWTAEYGIDFAGTDYARAVAYRDELRNFSAYRDCAIRIGEWDTTTTILHNLDTP